MLIIISQDQMGPSWGCSRGPQGVLGGFQTENTRNMGKYQKGETEKGSNLKVLSTKVLRYAYNYIPIPSGTIFGGPQGVLGGFQTENTQNMGKYQKLEREKVVKYKSFINKRTIWDHLGVLRGVLGGSQTKNTRNMGKYQKLETERTSKMVKSTIFIDKCLRIGSLSLSLAHSIIY